MINDFTIRTIISSILGHRHVPEDLIARHRRFRSIHALRLHLMRQPQFQITSANLQDNALQDALDPERDLVVFQHIPKCGGSSFQKLLGDQFGAPFAERHNGLGNWPSLALSKARYFSGHFDTPSLDLIPKTHLRVVTVLRNPVARLLSLYRFLRAKNPQAGPAQNRNIGLVNLARAQTPVAFFAHPDLMAHPSIHNAMTRQLAEPLCQKNWESFYLKGHAAGLTDTDPDQALARAMAHIETMAGVVLLEQIDATLPAVLAAIGLQADQSLPHENTIEEKIASDRWFEPTPKIEPTTELLEAIKPHIDLDRKLYDQTAELLALRGIL